MKVEVKFRRLVKGDAAKLVAYYKENKNHLEKWEPEREEGFYTEGFWKERLPKRLLLQEFGDAAYFLALDPSLSRIWATCNLTSVNRGAFMACYMGYSVAEYVEGKGVMKALCQHAISYAFNEMGLNRVMANCLPRNERSLNLLKSLGFNEEGYAKKYLKINGVWEDHILNAIVNPNSP